MRFSKQTNSQFAPFKPELGVLERREVPSATVTVVGGKMEITGDGSANAVVIRDDGSGNVSATVVTGSTQVTRSASKVNQIVVHTLGGDDSVSFQLTRNMLTALDLDVDVGAGNDRVAIDLYRGVSGVPLEIEIDGGVGYDSAQVQFGKINNANVTLDASLGQDSDSANVVFFDGVSGNSKIDANVSGDTGADRVDFNIMGKIDSAANLDIHASNSLDANDRLLLRYRGELDGNLSAEIDGAAAAYGVQARFALDPTSEGTLAVRARNAKGVRESSAQVTDHTGDAKVTILDRLENRLTAPAGIKVTRKS
jgi:hypothetical protein